MQKGLLLAHHAVLLTVALAREGRCRISSGNVLFWLRAHLQTLVSFADCFPGASPSPPVRQMQTFQQEGQPVPHVHVHEQRVRLAEPTMTDLAAFSIE